MAISASVKIEMDVPKIEPTVGTEIQFVSSEVLLDLKLSKVAAFATEFFHVIFVSCLIAMMC
ncbi:hypothetical protein [Exiguobacterium sp. KRL4]|uniref:hypothetical protein n=1 Tax=Exiguobacterium sp. KRL4 TaxID=1914536 RepID=UPI001F38F59A|nr:hypothetical protein [Exiguobacterium sp. KRL4]